MNQRNIPRTRATWRGGRYIVRPRDRFFFNFFVLSSDNQREFCMVWSDIEFHCVLVCRVDWLCLPCCAPFNCAMPADMQPLKVVRSGTPFWTELDENMSKCSSSNAHCIANKIKWGYRTQIWIKSEKSFRYGLWALACFVYFAHFLINLKMFLLKRIGEFIYQNKVQFLSFLS